MTPPQYGQLCVPCKREGRGDLWLSPQALTGHQLKEHPEEIERIALYAIKGHQRQAEYIYSRWPKSRQDNGILIYYMALGNPKLQYRRLEGQQIAFTAQYTDFFYFLRQIGGMTRAGRSIRQPTLTDSPLERRYMDGKRMGTREAVRRVMEIDPATRYNEGLLCAKLLGAFPLEGISLIYDHTQHTLTLTAPERKVPAVFRYIDSIARASRKHREKGQYTDSLVAEKRAIMQDFAQHYYGVEREQRG